MVKTHISAIFQPFFTFFHRRGTALCLTSGDSLQQAADRSLLGAVAELLGLHGLADLHRRRVLGGKKADAVQAHLALPGNGL